MKAGPSQELKWQSMGWHLGRFPGRLEVPAMQNTLIAISGTRERTEERPCTRKKERGADVSVHGLKAIEAVTVLL